MRWVVLDASAVAAWVLPSQTTRASQAFLADLDRFALAAPYIFRWEVANVLLVKARSRAIDLNASLAEVEALEVLISEPLPESEVFALTAFAKAARLSLFDAAYLGLAIETGAALASRDAGLLDAARAAGVDVFDLRD